MHRAFGIAAFGIAATLAIATVAVSSARADNDAQLWTQASARYQVSDPFRVSLNGLLRLEDDLSQLQNAALELELGYRLHDNFRIDGGYRWSNRRNNDGEIESRHRLYLDLRPRFRIGPIRFGYRLRFQESFRPGDDRHTVRNRIKVSHRRLDPVTPYAAFETFHRLGDGETIRLRTLRYTAGVDYQLSKAHEVGVYFRVETPEDGQNDPNALIAGLNYGFRF
ncbi:MAG: DUF2490 domain-containing protein [Deltaproteobacteria bacterium]|nr:DUF2490 domain-containing protein [Deltaproteobacteria bacterium]